MASETLSVADVLERAADLIEPEGRWAQGDFAFKANGKGAYADSKEAVCWCAMGAIIRSASEYEYSDYAIAKLNSLVGDIPDWNDAEDRTQAEVVAKLREAAALAREQQA